MNACGRVHIFISANNHWTSSIYTVTIYSGIYIYHTSKGQNDSSLRLGSEGSLFTGWLNNESTFNSLYLSRGFCFSMSFEIYKLHVYIIKTWKCETNLLNILHVILLYSKVQNSNIISNSRPLQMKL